TVARGREMLRENAELLNEVSERYGVQPRFIVAIWGIETRYGRVQGTMPVMPALATLAFDRRRSSFFRNELLQALRMVDAGHIELANLKGSWAGAMGQSQFIPSSYMAYAIDFDGDGRRDIWNSRADVFASIANYLKSHGWDDSATWGRQVSLPKGFDRKLAEIGEAEDGSCRALRRVTPEKKLSEWQALGVRRAGGGDLPGRDLEAALVPAEQTGGPAFLVYDNYRSILRYNCAHLYGLTVGMLADAISRP
ncbi:MAG: lytic murein transglycosylase, partial [Acetobacterales bacterium]